jgi:hypothetical protein
MTFVPVYATVSDNVSQAVGHTSSRRGKATNIHANVNTHFGEALNVDVSSKGNMPRKNVEYAESRIRDFFNKGNLKKVDFWKQRSKEYKEFNEYQETQERCSVDIQLTGLNGSDAKKFAYHFKTKNISYYFSSENLIEIFDNWDEINKILPQIKIAKALEDNNKKEESYY